MNILNIRIELTNPWDRWDYFKDLGCIWGKLGRYSAWELQHTYYSPLLADCEFRWNRRTDHAGIEIGIGLLGYGIHFRIYDTRHWNYDLNCYEERDYSEYFEINN
jgi:hypothetical protein